MIPIIIPYNSGPSPRELAFEASIEYSNNPALQKAFRDGVEWNPGSMTGSEFFFLFFIIFVLIFWFAVFFMGALSGFDPVRNSDRTVSWDTPASYIFWPHNVGKFVGKWLAGSK